jgi:hypothetical protein
MTRAKILLADIETAPLVGHTWGLWDQTIGLNQIEKEWAILSFAAKPLGGSKKDVIYEDTFGKADPRDDKDLCRTLLELLDEYDFVIAQNGKRFDLRKIRARLIMHGFPPHSPVKVIDTLLMAKQVAAFTSNKLEWLSEHLTDMPKEKHKDFPGFELWKEFLAGNPKARTAMRRYNIRDIDALEQVYLKLRPWVNDHPNVNVYHDDNDHVRCNRCGSSNVEKRGFAYTNVGQYHRYRCTDCGGWSRSRYTLNPIRARKNLTT